MKNAEEIALFVVEKMFVILVLQNYQAETATSISKCLVPTSLRH